MAMAKGELTPQSRAKLAQLRRLDGMPPLRKRMTIATSPLVAAIKDAVRHLPSSHSRYKTKERGGSLRNAVATTIQRKVRITQRTLLVIIKQVPKGGKSNLASVLEGTKPWIHPTYGHKPEVTQEPEPFFFDTIERTLPSLDREINRVLRDIDRQLR
jgi:hypothetical protein